MGRQPPRTCRHHPGQGDRPALHAVPVVAGFGLHLDGVGADGNRPGWACRRPQRPHRRTTRIHRPRCGTAPGDRPADRGCAASGPAAPAAGGPRTGTREFRRAGHPGAGDRAATVGRRHSRRHLAAADHAVLPARRGQPGRDRRSPRRRRATGEGPRIGRPDAAGGSRSHQRAATTGARRPRTGRRAGQPGAVHPPDRHRRRPCGDPPARPHRARVVPDRAGMPAERRQARQGQVRTAHLRRRSGRFRRCRPARNRRRRSGFRHVRASAGQRRDGRLRPVVDGGACRDRRRTAQHPVAPGFGHDGHRDHPAAVSCARRRKSPP